MRLIPDVPAGRDGDLLWKDGPFMRQLEFIADCIVDTMGCPTQHGMTIGIHGPWGAGKSSAIRIILDSCREIASQRGIDPKRLRTSTIHAPSALGASQPLREVVALETLKTIFGTLRDAIREYANLLPRQAGWAREPGSVLTDAVMQHKAAEEIVRDLTGRADFANLATELLSHGVAERCAYVLVIDDVDRCPEESIWEVIEVAHAWKRIPGVFVILAVDLPRLENAARARFAGADASTSLQKYVHHQLEVPAIDESAIAEYARRLAQDVGETANGRLFAVAGLIRYAIGSASPCPRAIKRLLNSLVQELTSNQQVTRRTLDSIEQAKLALFRLGWPELADRLRQAPFAQALADLELQLNQEGEKSLPPKQREFELRVIARRIAFLRERSIDAGEHQLLESLTMPTLEFLAAEPRMLRAFDKADDPTGGIQPLARAVSGARQQPVNDNPTQASSSDWQDDFMRLYMTSEAAEARNDIEECIRAASEALLLLNGVPAGEALRAMAPLIGNLALNAERENAELAKALYLQAYEADKAHPNNLQNYVDFELGQLEKRKYEPQTASEITHWIEEQITWLKQHAEDHKPTRTLALHRRLRSLTGEAANDLQDTADIDNIRRQWDNSPKDQESFVNMIASLVNFMPVSVAAMTSIVREFLATTARGNASLAYLAQRVYADSMATSGSTDNERVAIDIYRHICEGPEDLRHGDLADALPDAMHNLASLEAKHSYMGDALRHWILAYSMKRSDGQIRKAFSLSLMVSGDPSTAITVADGKPLEPQQEEKIRTLAASKESHPGFFTAEAERWWEGWFAL